MTHVQDVQDQYCWSQDSATAYRQAAHASKHDQNLAEEDGMASASMSPCRGRTRGATKENLFAFEA